MNLNSLFRIACVVFASTWLVGFAVLSQPASQVILAQSAVTVSAPSDTNEDTLATINVPALGPNARIQIYTMWSFTNNANNKTTRVRFNGGTGTIYMSGTNANLVAYHDLRFIQNRNEIGRAHV